jgi:hypothetical protein
MKGYLKGTRDSEEIDLVTGHTKAGHLLDERVSTTINDLLVPGGLDEGHPHGPDLLFGLGIVHPASEESMSCFPSPF